MIRDASQQRAALANRRTDPAREAAEIVGPMSIGPLARGKFPRLFPRVTPWLLLPVLALQLHAGTRSSANYSVSTDVIDSGGGRTTSASYVNDGSLGCIVGVGSVQSPAQTVKHGYIGQLYEVSGLQLASDPNTIDESGSLQILASQLLDDSTTLVLDPAAVTWSVLSGPLTGIDAGGLATAGLVYADMAATVQGIYQGLSGTLDLSVLDTIPDNFGSYAGDSIDDAWQFQYFGLNNPLAAPTADADATGQDNLFKFTAGINPIDHSTFTTLVATVTGQAGKMNVIFFPLVNGRTYTVEHTDSLGAGTWQPLTGFSLSDSGSTRTVTDNSASVTQRFYRVVISKP